MHQDMCKLNRTDCEVQIRHLTVHCVLYRVLVIVDQESQTASLNSDLLIELLRSNPPEPRDRVTVAANLLPADAEHYAQVGVAVLVILDADHLRTVFCTLRTNAILACQSSICRQRRAIYQHIWCYLLQSTTDECMCVWFLSRFKH